jgi:hypothetical protein
MSILSWISARFFGVTPDAPGVYRIRNRRNEKAYIGSTKYAIYLRVQEHIKELSAGTHHNHLLQKDWDRYGPTAFVFEVMENVDDLLRLEERELYWQKHIPAGKSYVLQLASPTRRRKGGYFMPSNVQYTDTMHPAVLIYAMAWAVYGNGDFVFEQARIEGLFSDRKGDAKRAAAFLVEKYRSEACPPVAPVTDDWIIKLLALQKGKPPAVPLLIPMP